MGKAGRRVSESVEDKKLTRKKAGKPFALAAFSVIPIPAESLGAHVLLDHFRDQEIAHERCVTISRVDGDREVSAAKTPRRAAIILRDINRNRKIHIESDIPKPTRHLIEV